jgi:DNA polymerase III epsilon subunit-like protein
MIRFPDIDFVIFDLEWSFWEDKQYILEIGAIKKRNGEILDKFYKLLKYNLPIPEKISELTGITNQNVENGEHRENSILEFLLFIEGSILVSHDIQGDLKVLKSEAYRLGLEVTNTILCTLKLSQKIFLAKKYNLYAIAQLIEIPFTENFRSHRADSDAEMTCKLFNQIIKELPEEIQTIKDIKTWNGEYKKLYDYKIVGEPHFDGNKNYRGFFDGASSGNPGKMGIGFAIIDEVGNAVYEGSQFIGKGTNNEAEYMALLSLLNVAKVGGIKNIKVFGDSQLVVKHIKREWKLNAENLKPLYKNVVNLIPSFNNFAIEWIRREENTLADALSKKSL